MANTDSTNAEGSLARAIWRLELARAKHVLRAYLRTRLLKLEACCAAVLADQAMQTRLSQRELQYAHVSPFNLTRKPVSATCTASCSALSCLTSETLPISLTLHAQPRM